MHTPSSAIIDVQSNPIKDVQPTILRVPPFACTFAYARSADAFNLNEYNQDAYTLRANAQRLVAVVADGVGQSFCGEVAAMAVTQSIMQAFWQMNDINESRILTVLNEYLVALAPKVTKILNDIDLSQHPQMFRDVLMQRRGYGSESVFVAILIDIPSNTMYCVWLGDCRLCIYDHTGNKVAIDENQFQTMERWSSTRVIHGKLHVFGMPASNVARVIAYSDGLQALDTLALVQPDVTTTIKNYMEKSRTLPESDDITIIVADVRR